MLDDLDAAPLARCRGRDPVVEAEPSGWRGGSRNSSDRPAIVERASTASSRRPTGCRRSTCDSPSTRRNYHSTMNTVLVTSTGESTGKTAITLALGVLATERGLDVGYMKPKGTRLQSSTGKTLDEDPMLARELLDIDAEMHQLEPVVYSPTFIQGAVRGRRTRMTSVSDFKRVSDVSDGTAAPRRGEQWPGDWQNRRPHRHRYRGVARRPCAVSHRLRHAQ